MSKKEIRVDFLINKMTAGGAERVVSLLANYLSLSPQYRIRIITFQGTDGYDLNTGIERIRLHKIFLFRSVVINGFFNLLWFYRKKNNRPDIMSSHIELLGYLTIPISIIYNIPLIVSEHNNHKANNSFWQSFLWDYLYKIPRAVTILTAYDLNFFRKRNRKVVIMPNPCTFQPFMESFDHKRKKEILAIGNLNRYWQKGFDNLISIMTEVFTNFPDWKLKIIGGGDEGLLYLKDLTKKYNLEKRIEFLGVRNDVQELLQNAEIFILPSRYEGLPMVLLESMSQGIACIAYDCLTGPGEIIQNNFNGFLVRDQDKEDMVEKLSELIENNDLRKMFGQNAPLVLEKYSIKSVGDKWMKLFEEVLTKH